MSQMRCLAIVVLTTMLAGCGFHLRGTAGYDFSLGEIHVTAANAYGELQREVERQLGQSGVELVDAEEAPYALRIARERTTRRPVATTSQISAAEYEVRLEATFELAGADGKTLLEPTTVFAERIYSFDSTSLVSSNEEEALLTEEMRRDIAGQIIRRVDASVRSSEDTGE